MMESASIVAWLIDGARSAKSPQEVLAQLCDGLVRSGIRLDRVRVFVQTLHPNIMGRVFSWRPGHEVEIGEAPTAMLGSVEFLASPVAWVSANGRSLRRRLVDPACVIDFPILAELREQGFSDFLCLPLAFSNGEAHVVTWATKSPDGFGAGEISALEAIASPLARVAEIWALRRIATNLLDTYVGRQSGTRILAGGIRRGDTTDIQAVIWQSDLRGFTPMADKLPSAELIALLNSFFDCQVPFIAAQGGEVLKFMGDGLLAIFPVADAQSVAKTCTAALAAARAMSSAIAAAPEEMPYGLALHIGQVSYGNIGGGDRLDFTCIGPAINMTARLEKLTAELREEVIASDEFARHLPHDFDYLGDFALKGFHARQPIYGLRSSNRAVPS